MLKNIFLCSLLLAFFTLGVPTIVSASVRPTTAPLLPVCPDEELSRRRESGLYDDILIQRLVKASIYGERVYVATFETMPVIDSDITDDMSAIIGPQKEQEHVSFRDMLSRLFIR